MSKELKFKAWDKVAEQWIYSDKFPSMWQYFKELENRGIRHFQSREFIGFDDKNGKNIYETDIVKFLNQDGGESIMQVVYYEPNASFVLQNQDNWCHRIELVCKPEVIGNIDENPELMKGV